MIFVSDSTIFKCLCQTSRLVYLIRNKHFCYCRVYSAKTNERREIIFLIVLIYISVLRI